MPGTFPALEHGTFRFWARLHPAVRNAANRVLVDAFLANPPSMTLIVDTVSAVQEHEVPPLA